MHHAAAFSDAEDIANLFFGQSATGATVSGWDRAIAAGGLFIPWVGGAGIKKGISEGFGWLGRMVRHGEEATRAFVKAVPGHRWKNGDHIVLGLENQGLRETAAELGGRHLMDDVHFMETVVNGAKDSATRFTVALDGLAGGGTTQQVMSAVQKGVASGTDAGFTNWELSVLYSHGRLADVAFVRNGHAVYNPFGGGLP